MTGSRISMREGVAIMYYICIVFKNVPLNFHSVHTFIYIYIYMYIYIYIYIYYMLSLSLSIVKFTKALYVCPFVV